jgi:ribosomal protein L11 methyltransferase
VKDLLLEIAFDGSPQIEELLQARLFTTASTGNTSAEVNGRTVISAYFDSAGDRADAMEALHDLTEIELSGIDRDRLDWLSIYQQSLEPMFIGNRFVVAPDPALIPADTERLRVVVPQEQAFGTGAHETTSLCIEMLESIELSGKRGLDIGSGSGILALAMFRLGAEKVFAFDNDLDAYAALRENRSRNNVAPESMPIFIGSIEALRGARFDVVTMNILPEVIMALLGEVVRHGAIGASIVLSGILTIRCDEVVRAAAIQGLRLERGRQKGEWWAGLFRRGLAHA